MRTFLLILYVMFFTPVCFSQNCRSIYEAAKKDREDGHFKNAIEKLNVLRTCLRKFPDTHNTELEKLADDLSLQVFNDVDSARIVALDQQQIAQRQKRIADTAKNIAIRQKNKAENNRDVAIKLASDGLVSQGYNVLDVDPALALNYAYSSIKLNYSASAINLIRDAVKKNLEWRKFVPQGVDEKGLTFINLGAEPYDPIVVNPEMTLLASVSTETKENKSLRSLTLIDVEKDIVLATRRLKETEKIFTPENSANLVSVLNDNKIQPSISIFDLRRKSLMAPLLVIKNSRYTAYTNGDWPIYSVINGDSLYRFVKTSSGIEHDFLGVFPNLKEVWPSPDTMTLALRQEDDIRFLAITNNVITENKSILPLISNLNITHFLKTKIKWKQNGRKFIIGMSYLSKDPERDFLERLIAIDPDKNLSQNIYDSLQSTDMFKPINFDAANDVTRIAYTYSSKRAESRFERDVYVADIEWLNNSDSLIRIKELKQLSLGKKPATFSEVQCTLLAPNGNYLFLAGAMHGESGTTTTGGDGNLWDLTSISSEVRTTLEPVPSKLYYGDQPIKRAVYSNNSKRILVYDENGVVHFFKVRDNLPRLFDQACTTEDEVLDRFWAKPSIKPLNNQELLFNYSSVNFLKANFSNGKITNLETYVKKGEEQIVDVIENEQLPSEFFILTNKRIIKVRDTRIIGTLELPKNIGEQMSHAIIVPRLNLIIVNNNARREFYLLDNGLNLLDTIRHDINLVKQFWIHSTSNSLVSLFVFNESKIYFCQLNLKEKNRLDNRFKEFGLVNNENEKILSYRYYGNYIAVTYIKNIHNVDPTSDKVATVTKLYKLGNKIEAIPMEIAENINSARDEDRYNNGTVVQDLFPVKDTILCGIFKPSFWNRYIALWNIKTNALLKVYETGPGSIQQFLTDKNGSVKYYTLFENDTLNVYSIINNNLVKKVGIGTSVVPPLLKLDGQNNIQLIGSIKSYLTWDRYFLLGGYNDASGLTNIKMLTQTRNAIDKIVRSLN
jgi:hypothetical protein